MFWISYERGQFLKRALVRAKVLILMLYGYIPGPSGRAGYGPTSAETVFEFHRGQECLSFASVGLPGLHKAICR
jgi:hypothetical protein